MQKEPAIGDRLERGAGPDGALSFGHAYCGRLATPRACRFIIKCALRQGLLFHSTRAAFQNPLT
jgi:hypothetical protein